MNSRERWQITMQLLHATDAPQPKLEVENARLCVFFIHEIHLFELSTFVASNEKRSDNDRSRWIAPVFQNHCSDPTLYVLE